MALLPLHEQAKFTTFTAESPKKVSDFKMHCQFDVLGPITPTLTTFCLPLYQCVVELCST